MNTVFKIFFVMISFFMSHNAFSQGVDLDGHVSIQVGFCEQGGLGGINAFDFLEQDASLELLRKAQLKCENSEVAHLMNRQGKEEIKKAITKIDINGCQETVHNDFLATASSGFLCKERSNNRPSCCINGYCSGEPFCER